MRPVLVVVQRQVAERAGGGGGRGSAAGRGTRGGRLPTQRSACARAFGARAGALITLIPSERKTSSRSRVNLLSRSRIRNRGSTPSSASCISRLRACWVTQRPVRVRRDPRQMDAPGRELDEEQDIEPLQEKRATVRKSHSRMLTACWRRNSAQLGSSRIRRWLDPRLPEDRPDRTRGELDPEPDQLALDPPIPQPGFSRASRTTSSRTASGVAGRPGVRCGTSSGAPPAHGANAKALPASRRTIPTPAAAMRD